MFKQVFCNHKTIFLVSWVASAAKGILGIANVFLLQYMIDAAVKGAFSISGKWLLALAVNYIMIQILGALITNLKISISNHKLNFAEREIVDFYAPQNLFRRWQVCGGVECKRKSSGDEAEHGYSVKTS